MIPGTFFVVVNFVDSVKKYPVGSLSLLDSEIERMRTHLPVEGSRIYGDSRVRYAFK